MIHFDQLDELLLDEELDELEQDELLDLKICFDECEDQVEQILEGLSLI